MITDTLKNAFPKSIDKTKPIFQAIVSNGKDAALEKVLKDAQSFGKEYCSNHSIYNQSDDMLMTTFKHFSYLERQTDETEGSIKTKFKAIFERKGDSVWGTPTNVKNVFQEYFPLGKIYLQEGTNDLSENLLKDEDFDEDVSSWTFENDAVKTREDSFSKIFCADLSKGYAQQQVEVESNKVYSLHFFAKGNVSVQIINNNNHYWDGSEWTSKKTEIQTVSSNNEWNARKIFFKSENSTNITIKFVNGGMVDYVQLYEKQPYHSFSVIAHFNGSDAKEALALAPGKDDTDKELKRDYDYYDNAFFTGVASSGTSQDMYKDLLESIRSVGVKGFVNIVKREFREGDKYEFRNVNR